MRPPRPNQFIPPSAQRRDNAKRDYNASRPHSSLGHLTPQEFAAKAARKGCS
ncbi:integrase core domain-containing protein [Belnapia mucosa]|uniref:integrase core domain-containing protein n=1 Tax=Belnapia mucosa TaxID=2804532 RepID=UPI0038B30F7B